MDFIPQDLVPEEMTEFIHYTAGFIEGFTGGNHPGEEISDVLLTDPRSIAFDQAENRLHAQAGLLHFLFSGA